VSGQPELALRFFERASAEEPGGRIGAAMALGQLRQPREGPAELEEVPKGGRNPEYHLVHAALLVDAGQTREAAVELDQRFDIRSARPDFVLEAARLLTSIKRESEALR
jgi:hypothetical protein